MYTRFSLPPFVSTVGDRDKLVNNKYLPLTNYETVRGGWGGEPTPLHGLDGSYFRYTPMSPSLYHVLPVKYCRPVCTLVWTEPSPSKNLSPAADLWD